MHLLFRILLQVQLLLKVVKFGPKLLFVSLNIGAVAFEGLDSSILLFLHLLDLFQLFVERGKFLLQLLSLLGLFWSLVSLQLYCLELEVLFKLNKLLAVENPF